MKKFYLLYFLLILQCMSTVQAQFSRNNNKKAVAYRADYFRISFNNSGYHNFEIRGGTLWAWGFNAGGQLGDGTTTTRSSAVQIGTDDRWVSIAPGVYHSIGLKSDGTLWAWGMNTYGQLGDGTTNAQTSPIQVGSDTDWVSISASVNHNLAIKSNGTLWAWGDNGAAVYGDGTVLTKKVPTQVSNDTNWVSVSTSKNHTLALKSDGTLWGWGSNIKGQIGDGTTTARLSPVQVGSNTNWVYICSGSEHSVALQADGTLWTWGFNLGGQLGISNFTSKSSPNQVGNDDDWTYAVAAGSHTLAIKCDGTLWGWGDNQLWQVGNGSSPGVNVPSQISSDNKWVSVSASLYSSFGLKSDGSLWGWGLNGTGNLGDSSTSNKSSPTLTRAKLKVWLTIQSGKNHSLGIKTDGTLWAWGANDYGQLGDSTKTNRAGLVGIGLDSKWTGITAGELHSLALRSNGTLWGWGDNTYGQLGDSNYTSRTQPNQVGSSNKWVSVSAKGNFTLGLKVDGTLWAWGLNDKGQLGNGTTTNHNYPIQIGNDQTWVSVAAGYQHALALKCDGTLWAWGNNASGQLGDGTTTDQTSPIQVGSSQDWIQMAAGIDYSLALKADGSLWAWGNNASGQFGNGSSNGSTSPMQIGNEKNWIQVSCGDSQTMALKAYGSLLTTGSNIYGQLGDSTNNNSNTYIQIGKDRNWVKVLAGGTFSTGLRSDRVQFCSTGKNDAGQLRDGSNTNKNEMNCNGCSSSNAPKNKTSNASMNLCYGDSTLLLGSGLGNLSWYDQPIGGNYLGAGSNLQTQSLKGDTTLYLQDSSCSGSTQRLGIQVKVTAKIVSAIITNQTICKGDAISIGGASNSTHSYIWNDQFGNFVSSSSNPIVQPNTTTRYYIEEKTLNGCSNVDSVLINVVDVKANAGVDKTICNGDSVYIGDTALTGSSYFWSTLMPGVNDTNAIALMKPSITTTYYLRVNQGSCIAYDTITIYVNVSPAAQVGSNNQLCMNDSITLGAVSISGNTYSWTSSPSGFVSNQSQVKVSPKSTTTYILKETISSTGCSKTNSLVVTVNPLPAAKVGSSQTICNEDVVTLGASSNAGRKYSWTSDTKTFTSSFANPQVMPNATTTYYLTETISQTGCAKSDSVKVTVIALPNIATQLNGVTISANQNGASYQWINCSTNAPIAGETAQSYKPKANGNYAVKITLNGCSDTSACVTISSIGIQTVYDENKLFHIYPNPNHGSFVIQSSDAVTYSIINQLGQLVKILYMNAGNNNQVEIDNLSQGIYYLTGYNQTQVILEKIVVVK